MSVANGVRWTWFLIVGLGIVAGCQPSAETQSSKGGSTADADTKRRLQASSVQPGVNRENSGSPSTAPAGAQPDFEPEARQPAIAASEPAAVEPPAQRPAAQAAPGDAASARSATDLGQIDPVELVMPRVFLTAGHAKTCLLKVGDPLPEIALADVDGKPQSLAKLMGERLTVVVFWKLASRYSLEELGDLGPDVIERFGGRGLRAVVIDEQDKAPAVREEARKRGFEFPILFDPNGAALAQLATSKLPRTYLVDASGNILWFDMEYSRSTHRELIQAIRFVLSSGSGG
jgi:peroxiredoxin